MKKYWSNIVIVLVGVVVFFIILTHEQKKSVVTGQSTIGKPITITFLDIGQGDATFFEWPDGTQMLVDCAKDSRILPALGRVMKFYDRSIDYLVVTHPDLDHYGGCIDVLKRFAVKHIVYDGYDKEYDPMVREFKRIIVNTGAEYFEPNTSTMWTVQSSTMNFLYPDHAIAVDPSIPGNTKDTSANNASVVFRLSYGDSDILMTGDMEAPLEEYLMKKYGTLLDVDILKVGHHGSAGSSSQSFLDLVTPKIATISAGAGNSYGHPTMRVLKRLERTNTCILRTDHEGDIRLLMYETRVTTKNKCE